MKRLCLVLLLLSTVVSMRAQVGVGKWRDCLDYTRVEHLEPAGELIYAAARNGLFCYDTLYGTLTRLNKTSGLSDAGIATIAFDPLTSALVVAYTNSNVDIITDGKVHNLSDIKRSDISGDKTIYRIRFHDKLAYLATGFGIVVVDLQRYEITETLYIGPNGSYTTVNDLVFFGDSLYASTTQGLKCIASNEPHKGISDRWASDQRLQGWNISSLDCIGSRLLVAAYTYDPRQITLFSLHGSEVNTWNSGSIRALHAHSGGVAVVHEIGVARYNAELELLDSVSQYKWGDLDCYDAVALADGTIWVGHLWDGLVRIRPDGTDDVFRPSGPYSQDNVYRIVPFERRTMICPGGHTTTYANSYLNANLPTTFGGAWSSLDNSGGLLNGVYDLVDAAVNPYDTNETMVALWGYGVASVNNGVVQQLFNADNTGGALQPYSVGDYTTLRTGALQFDRQGNLWILVSQSGNALVRRSADGSWTPFNTTALHAAPQVDKLVCDSVTGYLWFCGRDNVIYVHDGDSRMARVSPNNGSKLATDAVNALVQDRSGNLWVGTNKGIKVIYDGYNAFKNGGNGETSPVQCSNITITNGEFWEYLMAYESVTALAVDGANRKWVGTSSGGLYLLSANGQDQLLHFTAENSPLFSNKIIALAVQPRTGEVFVGTDRGVQVYRSTATYAESQPLDEVYAFPNPVRPDYDGPIAIKGFTRNANVHITDAAGHTVYTTQAFGGQAIWYGRNLNGQPVASGVYYVFAADAEGANRSVAKILIIR